VVPEFSFLAFEACIPSTSPCPGVLSMTENDADMLRTDFSRDGADTTSHVKAFLNHPPANSTIGWLASKLSMPCWMDFPGEV
jgi:hypothetical protein